MTYVNPNAYHGMDPELGAPFDRFFCRRRGAWFRVETDGHGGLCEVRERSRMPEPISGRYQGVRRTARSLIAKLESAVVPPDERVEMVRDLLAAEGAMTTRTISERMGCYNMEVVKALAVLQGRGEAYVRYECASGVPTGLWSLHRNGRTD